jgi:hypothetical protein
MGDLHLIFIVSDGDTHRQAVIKKLMRLLTQFSSQSKITLAK